LVPANLPAEKHIEAPGAQLGGGVFRDLAEGRRLGFREVRIYTKKGDDGTTGLLYGGRVAKDDARTDVYGTLDEAVSALGLARAARPTGRVDDIVVRVQREMFVAGAQLATAEGNQAKLEPDVSRVTPEMTSRAEADIDALIGEHPLPQEFVLPGETMASAALDLARSVVRRAERRAVAMDREGLMPDPEILRYLNRVSDLLFVLARYEEAERGTRAKPSRQR
jgi:cob(I)alamin adenosyltransferase